MTKRYFVPDKIQNPKFLLLVVGDYTETCYRLDRTIVQNPIKKAGLEMCLQFVKEGYWREITEAEAALLI